MLLLDVLTSCLKCSLFPKTSSCAASAIKRRGGVTLRKTRELAECGTRLLQRGDRNPQLFASSPGCVCCARAFDFDVERKSGILPTNQFPLTFRSREVIVFSGPPRWGTVSFGSPRSLGGPRLALSVASALSSCLAHSSSGGAIGSPCSKLQ